MDKKEIDEKFISKWSSVIFTIFLTLVFIGLKIFNIIDWKWIWVLSPIWIHIIQMFIILLISGVSFLILGLVYYLFGKEDKK